MLSSKELLITNKLDALSKDAWHFCILYVCVFIYLHVYNMVKVITGLYKVTVSVNYVEQSTDSPYTQMKHFVKALELSSS